MQMLSECFPTRVRRRLWMSPQARWLLQTIWFQCPQTYQVYTMATFSSFRVCYTHSRLLRNNPPSLRDKFHCSTSYQCCQLVCIRIPNLKFLVYFLSAWYIHFDLVHMKNLLCSKPWLIRIRFDPRFYPVWAKIRINRRRLFLAWHHLNTEISVKIIKIEYIYDPTADFRRSTTNLLMYFQWYIRLVTVISS